jgi:hypothetical protein
MRQIRAKDVDDMVLEAVSFAIMNRLTVSVAKVFCKGVYVFGGRFT